LWVSSNGQKKINKT